MTEKDPRKLLDRLGWKGKLVKHIVPGWGIFGSIGLLIYFSIKGDFLAGLFYGGINFVLSIIVAIIVSYVLAWWFEDFPWTIDQS